jgi:hypothetical protein
MGHSFITDAPRGLALFGPVTGLVVIVIESLCKNKFHF